MQTVTGQHGAVELGGAVISGRAVMFSVGVAVHAGGVMRGGSVPWVH